ncbi:MAG: SPOR domain-containing protein [Gemmatimonadota bacterium]|nr:MAG: SPOR domain-containing protein [Gemmatimonadota bacterium]
MDSSAPRGDVTWPHAATLVLAAENPRQRRWAVNTAIEIVRKLAAQRSKVVLADLQTRTPSALAAALGAEGGPGISDVLFRDTAFSKVANRPEGETFFFLTVGDAPPTLQVLYRHPRWKKIAARLEDTDAHLIPCVAASDWLDAGPIPGFEACIVLNAAGLEVELPSEARRLAEFLAPPEIREGDNGSVELPWYATAEPETQPIPGVARPVSDPAVRPVSGAESPAPAAAPSPPQQGIAADWSTASTPAAGRGPLFRGSRRGRIAPFAVAAAAAALVLALWQTLGSRQIPEGPVQLEAAAGTVSVGERATGPRAEGPADQGPRLQEVSLPYSVAIAAFSSLDDAVTRQREWTRADLPFYVAPTVVQGVVYYRVFAGMLPERARAEELMAELVREGIKDTIRSWDIRPARLAFNFGTYASSQEARTVLETLFGRGVPAYMVPAVGGSGEDSIAYRVYAGGYERPEDARPLSEHIERAGFNVELVERVGLQLK